MTFDALMIGRRDKLRARQHPVVIINGEPGGFAIAAHVRRHPVIGSYDTTGQGFSVQRFNYPGLTYRTDDWLPDLDGVIVLAQLPVDGPKDALWYALNNRCDALAVETAVSAVSVHWQLHQDLADAHGYHLFRLLLNSVTMGTPQWRPRLWVLFIRKKVALRPDLIIHHSPVRTTAWDILDPSVTDADDSQVSPADRAAWWGGQDFEHLKPDSFTPELQPSSRWACGRPLTQLEYQRCCGFPDHHAWPPGVDVQGHLARAVAPTVAAWILQTIDLNLHARHHYYTGRGFSHGILKPESDILEPNQVANLCLSYKLWKEME